MTPSGYPSPRWILYFFHHSLSPAGSKGEGVRAGAGAGAGEKPRGKWARARQGGVAGQGKAGQPLQAVPGPACSCKAGGVPQAPSPASGWQVKGRAGKSVYSRHRFSSFWRMPRLYGGLFCWVRPCTGAKRGGHSGSTNRKKRGIGGLQLKVGGWSSTGLPAEQAGGQAGRQAEQAGDNPRQGITCDGLLPALISLALKKAKMECCLGGPPTSGLWLYLLAEVMGGMTRSCTARTACTAGTA